MSYNPDGDATANSAIGTYAYKPPGTGQPQAVQTASTRSYVYDAAGRMTSRDGEVINWNGDGKPSSIGSTQMTYGGTGERLKKVTGSSVTRYVGGNYEIAPDGTVTKTLIGGKQVGTDFFVHHRDHLGSIQAVTDAAGIEVRRQDHTPFGDQHYAYGSHAESKGWIGEREEETELVYLNARYYDPEIARFTSPDPIVLPGQLLNRYTYSINNPINLSDPSGLLVYDPNEEAASTTSMIVNAALSGAGIFFGGGQDRNRRELEPNDMISDDERINEAYRQLLDMLDSDRLDPDERVLLSRAVWAFQYEGVTVRFETPENQVPDGFASFADPIRLETDANGRYKRDENDLAVVRIEVTLALDERLQGLDLAIALAHEGAHVAQMQEFGWQLANAIELTGPSPVGSKVDLTLYKQEHLAYSVSALAAEAAGFDTYTYGGQYTIFADGGFQEDAANAWIAELYDVTPDVQGDTFSVEWRR